MTFFQPMTFQDYLESVFHKPDSCGFHVIESFGSGFDRVLHFIRNALCLGFFNVVVDSGIPNLWKP